MHLQGFPVLKIMRNFLPVVYYGYTRLPDESINKNHTIKSKQDSEDEDDTEKGYPVM